MAIWSTGSILIGFYRKRLRVRIHLSGQRRELGGISLILVSIEADRSRVFVFVEQVLHEIYYADVAMMRSFRKHACDQLIGLRHEIV